MYVYGGFDDPNNMDDMYNPSKQYISQLTGTQLTVVGTLPSYFNLEFEKISVNQLGGACSTMGNSFVFLCFFMEKDECYRAENPLGEFMAIQKSNYHHWSTQTSASDS